jgi:hypothetical protein
VQSKGKLVTRSEKICVSNRDQIGQKDMFGKRNSSSLRAFIYEI